VIGLAVTSLRFKMGHYFTPMFPFLALLSAHGLGDWIASSARREERFYAGLSVVTPAFLAFLLVWPVSFGPEAFVALRRFVPYIQTHGSCDDVVALVPGGEPVGSELDYKLYLGFYTGRTIESVACEQISQRVLSAAPPTWLVVDDEHLKRCVTPEARARYSTRLLVGTQYLLTSLIRPVAGLTLDLTPLELDRQAVRDCQAPPYPQDRWHRYLEAR
jgi:hypothetical protein